MRNRRGEGYISICVMVLVICMLLSATMVFAGAVNTVSIAERNAKTVLDSYIMKNSIIIYNSIKNGSSYTESLDADKYTEDLCSFSSLTQDGSVYKAENGSYYITQPVVGFTTDNRLKLYASFTVFVPIEFNGTVIQTAEVPITVTANLDEKF